MLRTPLHQYHLSHGGKMVDFAGWEMPILYAPTNGTPGGIHEEHKAVRSGAGLFDVSHMGRVKITGRHARRFLERLCTRKISDMQNGQCRYSLVCNEKGGVRDDVLVYKIDDDDYLLVVNASNRLKLLDHFAAIKGDLIVTIDDRTAKTAMVALQGPKVMEMIGAFSREIPTLKRYRFVEKNYLVMKLLVSRTGYTGEDGVEVILPSGMVDLAMKMLLRDGGDKGTAVRPAGLGARDTLRMEAGMPLYGHELGEETSALASGLDFAISLDKDQGERGEAFIGMDALKRHRDAGGPPKKLIGLLIDGKRTARQGMIVLDTTGTREVGDVTSACVSPTLDRPIAMAYVDASLAKPGVALKINPGRGEMLTATTTALPFYTAPKA